MPGRGQQTHRYYPGPIPVGLDPKLLEFLRREFFAVYLGQEGIWNLPIRHIEPEKYQEGSLVYADGTNWNPGSGKGVYVYNGTSWIKL